MQRKTCTFSLTFIVLNMVRGEETDRPGGQDLPLPPGGVILRQDFDHFVRLEAQLVVVLRLERVDRNHSFCGRTLDQVRPESVWETDLLYRMMKPAPSPCPEWSEWMRHRTRHSEHSEA